MIFSPQCQLPGANLFSKKDGTGAQGSSVIADQLFGVASLSGRGIRPPEARRSTGEGGRGRADGAGLAFVELSDGHNELFRSVVQSLLSDMTTRRTKRRSVPLSDIRCLDFRP